MSIYKRVLSKLAESSLKNVPGLEDGKTKLAVGTVLYGEKGFKYTIADIYDEDPSNVSYLLNGDNYQQVVNSKDIKQYSLDLED